jgi:hypothetical protein
LWIIFIAWAERPPRRVDFPSYIFHELADLMF